MATSRNNQSCLSVRNQNGKQVNPITGQEMHQGTPRIQAIEKEKSSGDLKTVPSLNLKYLKDDEIKTGAIDIDLRLNDYCMDSPNSASTVSWGTGRSTGSYRPESKVQISKLERISVRPEGVPSLNLGVRPSSARKPAVKQPTAWDKEAVPCDVPPPSARHKELYQQYAEEMKQSYREHVNPPKKDAVNGVYKISSAREEKSKVDGEESLNDEFHLNDNWLKQRYTGVQLMKKKDIEDLFEQNKKQKLIETVMIDQLSRAVISDPEQNELYTSRPSSARRGRGTNRYLHDTKISTASTATENLLSKRVRFGARIITRDGHDAMRELTGFYFAFDKTLTVYEFRQFGKSAKAMPFIYCGQYIHSSGPKSGLPYSISDIYSGATLKIPTEGQLALTDSLSKNKYIVLRITDVDEDERDQLIAERKMDDQRSHAPSQIDIDHKEFLKSVQDEIKTKISKRGIRTYTGLGRFYRKLDHYKTGILDQFDLEKGLKVYHIDLDLEKLEEVFEILDPEGNKLLDYGEYMHSLLGEMNEYRKALVRKAFRKLDNGKKGTIHISDVNKFFNVNSKYKPKSDGHMNQSALQAFIEDVRENDKDEFISYIEFEEYYEGLSLGIKSDEEFANILRNTWNI
ncbi:calcyphosin-2 [Biomphalaria pfeifferi]|uniref:Calcyphosin-2 n=1 Tax=Biomphalaria pfeifferi TaxID=112525 RepID=A0AAD8BE06_BIOPF|nr:calcyphosin-2 [Biomphalaria pfeifferi]